MEAKPPNQPPTEDPQLQIALNYLNEVKKQFENQPEIYSAFFEIMKSFKAESIGRNEVIQKICTLFKGYPHLILGFNQFLPPGFEVQPNEISPSPTPILAPSTHADNYINGTNYNDAAAATTVKTEEGQPPEFDYAINYVNRVKKRFTSEPDKYKQFLEILHTYQKEKRTIKEVLDQIYDLFREHADLLEDFAYFLPDHLRDKAKQDILNRKKKDDAGNLKKRIKKDQQQQQQQQQQQRERFSKRTIRKPLPPSMIYSSRRANIHSPTSQLEEEEDSPTTITPPPPSIIHAANVRLLKLPKLEKNLFNRIKTSLGSQQRWNEFLKCLELFSNEIIKRTELITLLKDIFSINSNLPLLEEFDRNLASRGLTDNSYEDFWFCLPSSDIDFSKSQQATPSYWSLPPNYPKPPCSERTTLCHSVLNDVWVAVPNEIDFDNRIRRNQYEEQLFQCEDDRYELDMVIETNLSCIQVLEKLNNELTLLSCSTPYKLPPKSLSVLNLKAISRAYGDRSEEIFQLFKNLQEMQSQ